MSATQSRSGPVAAKSRSTRSGAGRPSTLRRVVVTRRLRRLMPTIWARRISRATRFRPTRTASSSRSSRWMRGAPYVPREAHGSARCARGAPRLRPLAVTPDASRTRSSRSGRRPAPGTASAPDTGPVALSRIRNPWTESSRSPARTRPRLFSGSPVRLRACLFSRRRRRSSSRSSLVRPSLRLPLSRSAWATQLRIAWPTARTRAPAPPGCVPTDQLHQSLP